MEGRWTLGVWADGAHVLWRDIVPRRTEDADLTKTPVVPCDKQAVERAMQAIIDSDDVIPNGEEPEMVGWALTLAERALRAAGEVA